MIGALIAVLVFGAVAIFVWHYAKRTSGTPLLPATAQPAATGGAPVANPPAGGAPAPPKNKWVGWTVGGAAAIAAILVLTLVVIPMITDGTVAAIDWEMLLIWSIPVVAIALLGVGLANTKERKPLIVWGVALLVIFAIVGASGMQMLRSKVQTAIADSMVQEPTPNEWVKYTVPPKTQGVLQISIGGRCYQTGFNSQEEAARVKILSEINVGGQIYTKDGKFQAVSVDDQPAEILVRVWGNGTNCTL